MAMEYKRGRDAERNAYLLAQLDPRETVVTSGPQALVTNRRVLFAWLLYLPPRAREWTHDALTFDEITRWTLGRRHDHRPLLRLEHPRHVRVEHVIAHRLLLFRWGNTEREVSHEETTLYFRSDRDPVFAAMSERLRETSAQKGDSFVVALRGTRQERRGASIAMYRLVGDPRLFRHRRWVTYRADRIYRGRVAWPVRLVSWLILAVPAWFIVPWLVFAAIALAEVAWIAGLQWSGGRDRHRGPASSEEDYEYW